MESKRKIAHLTRPVGYSRISSHLLGYTVKISIVHMQEKGLAFYVRENLPLSKSPAQYLISVFAVNKSQ